MFKFATNKFNGGGSSSSNQNNSKSLSLDSNSHHASQQHHHSQHNTKDDANHQLPNINMSNAAVSSRRRQLIQKDLFAFNKIADKGFPSKPSAMDFDRKLKLLAIGTKNGDIRIYGSPGTQQQQLSCYQDVHPFPIQRILFIQGQHQLITLSERVQRNDLTNKSEPHLFLVLWQIPHSPVLNGHGEQQQQQQPVNAASASGASYLVEKIKEFELEPEVINGSRLSAITLLNDNSHLFLGFETGDVYVFNVSVFQLVPGVINKDFILKNLSEPSPGQKKLTQLGAVESICHHPRQLTKLLIAYQRGLWIIFDFIKNQIDQINQTSQQLESAVFYQAGECVATSHSDGSFILWDLESSQLNNNNNNSGKPATCSSSSAPNIVYGPYPCKPVTKCLVKTCKNDQPYVIFSGGCPRINYSDKITISVIQGESGHVCFDFTSKIIDYFTVDKPTLDRNTDTAAASALNANTAISYDNPQALFVLLEEEFVAIDLCSDGWPQYKLPYLYSVHSSAIICTHYVNNVSGRFYERLKAYGNLNQDPTELFSDKEWPITLPTPPNGPNSSSPTKQPQQTQQQKSNKDLLLTGHEDGSIRFWDVTQMSMTLIYRLKTSDYFQTEANCGMPGQDDSVAENQDQLNGGCDSDNWPPFRKVGTFDPYSDDPKLGIQKIFLCAQRELLVVAGTAGQVLVMSLNDQIKECNNISVNKINIIGSSPEVESCFMWKGHEPLAVRSISGSSPFKLQPGYQLQSLIQLYPPATVSALALSTDWQLVAMGTSYGFALFDYLSLKPLLIRCTLDPAVAMQQQLNPNDSGTYGHQHGNTISRRKSLKKSLRESFRKLRRGRSQKPQASAAKSNTLTGNHRQTLINTTSQMRVEHLEDEDGGGQHKPIERQVESREFKPMDDIPPSVIRYMYFVRTFITNSQQLTNSLWVGTNTGIIYIYALQFMSQPLSKSVTLHMVRTNQAVNCLLAKEMRLKHRAPVVNIQVIDQNMQPLPYFNENTADQQQQIALAENHKVIICSEEQFKVFQLPTLKPVCKFKLTAVEGARVRRIGYNCYTSRTDPKYQEHCLSCLSNLGDLSVYSLPQLKRQVQIQCMKQQDINAITSFVFSKQGQAFYLQSPSEFVHISMSARDSPATLRLQHKPNQQQQQHQQQQHVIANQQQGNKSTNVNGNNSATKPANSKQEPPAKPRQTTPQSNKQTTSNTNPSTTTTTTTPLTSSTIASPSSPPPPVPAPRTILPKDEQPTAPVTTNRKQINDSKQVDPSPTLQFSSPTATNNTINSSSTLPDEPSSQSAPENLTKSPTKSLNKIAASPSKSIKQMLINDESVNTPPLPPLPSQLATTAKPAPLDQYDLTVINKVKLPAECGQEPDPNKISPVKKISTEIINTSTTTTTSGVSQLSSLLDQSSVSANTNSHSIQPHSNNNNNISMITMTQSDSFNVSSSGYNGSISCVGGNVSSFMGGNVDMSMDSVVDKFNDEYHDVSTRKIPAVIDENLSTTNLNNDSLLNESNLLDMNRLNLNSENGTSVQITNGKHHSSNTNGHHANGHHHHNNGHANGQINLTFDNESDNQKTKPTPNKNSKSTSNRNGFSNGNDNHHLNEQEDDHIDSLAPQKSSSPLVKTNGQTNGSAHCTNGSGNMRNVNKIEQVTKRIENGSKLEYRETAID